MSERAARICCLDLDTFFVSVERLLDPTLVGKPVIVGAVPGSNRGVVTSCSYEVRPLGVRSGMPISEARQLAPHAIFLPTRHSTYSPYAEQVREVLERYTPAVQTASIDEFFLDFRGCEGLYRRQFRLTNADDAIETAIRDMREAIQRDVGLPASAGVGCTRPIAKMASNVAKPAGVHMVRAGTEHAFVVDLPVRRYPGIGPVMERKLIEAGVHTLGQLIELPPGPLRARFGRLSEGVNKRVYGMARDLGRDRPAFQEHDPNGLTVGSISNERTIGAVRDRRRLEDQLRGLAERVCWRARKRDIRARTVTLKLRYAGFETLTRGRTLDPTNDESTVYGCVRELFDDNWTGRAIRLVGVKLSNLLPPDPQLTLSCCEPDRPAPGKAIDAVRKRFGYDAIRLGASPRRTRREWLGGR